MIQPERWQLAAGAAENYERYQVPVVFGPLAEELVELAGPRPGERVLDVACGTGIVARCAAERLGGDGRVVGWTSTRGCSTSPAWSRPPRGWRSSGARGAPSRCRSPRGPSTWCSASRRSSSSPRAAALREMRPVLTTGGRLALSVFRSIGHRPEVAALAAALERHVGPEAGATRRAVSALGDAGELERLVTGAGFRTVKIRAVVKTQRDASAEEYLRRIELAAPSTDSLRQIDEPARHAILADLSTALRSYLTDDALILPVPTHLATARKSHGHPRPVRRSSPVGALGT